MVLNDSPTPSYVFISYSRDNNDFVQRLSSDLKKLGIVAWIDKEGLKAGTRNWELAIRKAIQGCYAILLIASPNAFESEFVQGEIAIAKGYNRPIYPIWAAGERWIDCVPMDMSKIQFIDARGDDTYTSALDQITQALGGVGIPSLPTIRNEIAAKSKLPSNFIPQNPYKGLRAFTSEDTERFFGRDTFTLELVDTLKPTLTGSAPRFLALIGASGSGKSSIMLAGLIPRLKSGALHGSDSWVYIDRILPGNQPINALADALYRALPSKNYHVIEQDLRHQSGMGLHHVARNITTSGRWVVLYIDQFEELYTQTTNKEEREQFINLLVTASTEPDGVVLVLVTLRADFYDRPLQDERLGKLIEVGSKAILPLTLPELYEAIEKPALLPKSQLTFDDGLVTDLVFAVRDETGGLPLLQFTLDLLYERRNGMRLTRAAYDAVGGLRGALAKHAEATYMELPDDEHRYFARSLFLRLIEPGMTPQDTTRRRAALNELELPDAKQRDILRNTADSFIQSRLLLTNRLGNIDTIEVGHEALIREWSRLGDWLHEAREDVGFQKEIASDSAEWLKRGKPSDMLYRGTVLEDAQRWASTNAASAAEVKFLEASVQDEARRRQELIDLKHDAEKETTRAEHQRKLARLAMGLASLFILVALGTGWFAINAQNDSIQQGQNAAATSISAQKQVNVSVALQATANHSLLEATTTLASLKNQVTAVAAQATYFSIELGRIGTLSAGAVVLPPGTLTPELLLPTLTGIAHLRTWQPHIVKDTNTSFNIEMVEVPPGCFMMGSITGGDEQPINEQCFETSFYIDRYEVTNVQFDALKGQAAKDSYYCDPNQDKTITEGERAECALRPRESVTWFEARDFCELRGARLPSEREREYVARGFDSLIYPWGNYFVPENVVYNRVHTQGTAPVMNTDGTPVRPNGASWVGALDISGNVYEWTNTKYDDVDYSLQTLNLQGLFPYPYIVDDGREAYETKIAYDKRSSQTNFYTLRVLRGGSWDNTVADLRSAARTWNFSSVDYENYGFRCARSSEP